MTHPRPADAVRPVEPSSPPAMKLVTVTPKPATAGVREEVREPGGVTPAEGMRYYAAILGREPTVDPAAPNLLPRMTPGEPPPASWAAEVSRTVRSELARRLHMTLQRRPTWRELMDAMTAAATRRIDDARRRFNAPVGGGEADRRKAA